MQCESHRHGVNGLFRVILLLCGWQASLMAQTSEAVPSEGAVTIESTPPGALVYLTGEYQFVGRTPFLLPYPLYGKYRLQANRRGYNTVVSEHNFTGESNSVVKLRLSAKTPLKAFSRSLLFPGWGQFYSGRKAAGSFHVGTTAVAGIALAIRENHYKDAQTDYEAAYENYQRGGSFDDEQQAFNRLQSAWQKLDKAKNYRNTSLYLLVGFWALNVLESVLFFPKDNQEIEIFQKLSARVTQDSHKGIKLTMQFPIN
jgi:hypothetical protein